MKVLLNGVQATLVALACTGMLLPLQQVAAQQGPVRPAPGPAEGILDIALAEGGYLQGQVLGPSGNPLTDTPVEVWQAGGRVATARTDAAGQFVVPNLRGGVYQITAGDQSQLCRCWAPHTAPPAAQNRLLLVPGDVQRGQRPIGDLLAHPVVIGAIIAAAIAIPIAIHNSKDDPSGS